MQKIIPVICLMFLMAACRTEPTYVCTGSLVKHCESAVFFDLNEARLNENAKQYLRWAVKKAQWRKNAKVIISVHEDLIGPQNVTASLSRQRVLNVAKFMAENGVDANRIEMRYFGQKKLRSVDPQNQGMNRRVEIDFE